MRSKRSTKKRQTRRKRTFRPRKMSGGGTSARFVLKSIGTISSDGAGLISDDTTCDQVYNVPAGNFSSLAALYEMYIVRAISVKYFPINVGEEDFATTYRGSSGTFIDYDGTSVASTFANAVEYDTFKMHQSRAVIKRYVGIPKKLRTELNSTTAVFDTDNKNVLIRLIGQTFTNATPFWYFVKKYYVEFLSVK